MPAPNLNYKDKELYRYPWGKYIDQIRDAYNYLLQNGVAAWGAIDGSIDDQADLMAKFEEISAKATWSNITGEIDDQADLKAKFDAVEAEITALGVTSGVFVDAVKFDKAFRDYGEKELNSAVDLLVDPTGAVDGNGGEIDVKIGAGGSLTISQMNRAGATAIDNEEGALNTIVFFRIRGLYFYTVMAVTKLDALTAPSDVTATADGSYTINIAWTNPAGGRANTVLEHNAVSNDPDDVNWAVLATLTDETTYAHERLNGNETHYYRLKATGDFVTNRSSVYSTIVNATTEIDAHTPEVLIFEGLTNCTQDPITGDITATGQAAGWISTKNFWGNRALEWKVKQIENNDIALGLRIIPNNPATYNDFMAGLYIKRETSWQNWPVTSAYAIGMGGIYYWTSIEGGANTKHRITRINGAFTIQYSIDNGATWTTQGAITYENADDMWIAFTIQSAGGVISAPVMYTV